MKRSVLIGIVIAVLVALGVGYAVLAGSQRSVSVENGVRVVCTYGHVVSDTVEMVEVPASQASEYSVQTRTVTCPEHQQAEQLYRDAQQSIARADLKAAAERLAKVVALDAGFRQAKAQLADIKAGRKPKVDTQTAGSTASEPETSTGGSANPKPGTPGDEEPDGPVASLSKWLPDDIAGYSAEPVAADAFAITRNYAPKDGPKTKQLVIAAEQVGSADKVDAAIEANVRLLYTADAASFKVGGKPAYVGTNGRGTAVVAIADGPVLVILQLTDDGGAKALADELVDISATLPR